MEKGRVNKRKKDELAWLGLSHYSKESFYYCISNSSVKLLIELAQSSRKIPSLFTQKPIDPTNTTTYEIGAVAIESKYIYALYSMSSRLEKLLFLI